MHSDETIPEDPVPPDQDEQQVRGPESEPSPAAPDDGPDSGGGEARPEE